MTQVPVRDIKIRNSEFLNILNEYKDVLLMKDHPDDKYLVAKALQVNGRDQLNDADKWLNDEYLSEIRNAGRSHSGFPAVLCGYSGLKPADAVQGREALENDYTVRVREATAKLNAELITVLSCRNNALNACYPPGGFISWHNNANAPGYNIIMTYSETGEGWFDYWDNEKQERVRIPDVPGWQAKMTYFGPYEEEDKLCYHAAYTDCYRITVAFVFAHADNFWEEVIEDIETPI